MMDKVTILGTRGSVPVGGPQFARFGGDTTAVLAELGGQKIVLDAGTGLMHLPASVLDVPELPLLLSHFHLDHLLGLPLCPYLLHRGGCLAVYAEEHEGLDAETALRRLFAPPLWPVPVTELPAGLRFHAAESGMLLGDVRIDLLQGAHPNGVTVFRLTCGEKRLVFASDCTLTPELLPRLTEFAADCDLLLCDGQYSEEEWPGRSSFGHSTWTAAARLAEACGAKRLRVIHHDPTHDDAALERAEAEIRRSCPRGAAARQGEEILL